MPFFTARCLPCGIPLERAVRIDVSSANCRAKSHFRLRTSERNPIFGCPPLRCPLLLREAKPGGFQTGGFPTFLGKVQIVSRTLSGLFLVRALNRPRKRKRTNREDPRRVPGQIGKFPKRTKKEGQVQIGKPPRLKPPRLAALDF